MKLLAMGLAVWLALLASGCATQEAAPTPSETTPAPQATVTSPAVESRTPETTATPQAVPETTPPQAAESTPFAEDVKPKLVSVVQDYFAAYNEGDFARASSYVSDEGVRRCGGALNFAYAFRQLQDSERLRYELDGLEVNSIEGDRVWADVTFSSYDIDTGKRWDDHLTIGPYFIRENGEWVLDIDPLPILAVMAFCPR